MDRIFIDVREPFEYMLGHVKGAINIPLSKISAETNKLNEIPKETELVLYCNSGNRSNSSMNILRDMGYTNLVNGINKSHVKAKFNI